MYRLETVDGTLLSASTPIGEICLEREPPWILVLLEEGLSGQILSSHPPAETPVGVAQIMSAHQRGVLLRLIAGEMGHQPAVSERECVAVHDKHAAIAPASRSHLPPAAHRVGIATQRIEPAPRRAAGPANLASCRPAPPRVGRRIEPES